MVVFFHNIPRGAPTPCVQKWGGGEENPGGVKQNLFGEDYTIAPPGRPRKKALRREGSTSVTNPRWNPKMAPYIYTERNGIYIIDLQKTVKKLEEAYNFVRDPRENGQTLLFVGTKKQAQEAIKEEATRCGLYYVNARWLGGMLTNFKTMRGRVDRLNQLKKMQEDGTFDMLPKKEVMKHLGEIAKLEKYLGGVTEMKKLPGALFSWWTPQGAQRHQRGPQAAHPHRGHRGHQLRSRRDRLRHPRQRRRHPRHQADLRRHGQRHPGGQAGRADAAEAAAEKAEAAE